MILDFESRFGKMLLKLLPARYAARPRAGLFISGGFGAS